MTSVIEDKLAQIAEICRHHHVRRLDVFGSALTEHFDAESSDIDLLVDFLPEAKGGFDHPYYGLHAELEALFEKSVDLVVDRAIRNPYFREGIERSRQVIYEAREQEAPMGHS